MKTRQTRRRQRKFARFLTPINVYCLMAIIGMAVLLGYFFASRGELIERYFFYDTLDTGMDFFHSIEYVNGREPYALFHTLYPPMANLFFYIIYLLIPSKVSSLWPMGGHGENIGTRGTNLDLRVAQAPLLLFLIVIIIVAIGLMALFITELKHKPSFPAKLAACCMILSPGILSAVERGNVLIVAMLFLFFFLLFWNSNNKFLREMSLIALAISAGIKLYPALFGMLLLWKKQYARAARAILYGILAVIVPLLFFKEGLSAIPTWLSITLNFSEIPSRVDPWIGSSFANILHRAAHYLDVYRHIQIDTSWFSIAAHGLAGFLLVLSLTMRKEWQVEFTIALAIDMFQPLGSYICALFLPALLSFLKTEERICMKNVVPFFLLVFITIHLPLFYKRSESYPNMVFYQCFAIVAICWCVVTAVKHTIHSIKRRRASSVNMENRS